MAINLLYYFFGLANLLLPCSNILPYLFIEYVNIFLTDL